MSTAGRRIGVATVGVVLALIAAPAAAPACNNPSVGRASPSNPTPSPGSNVSFVPLNMDPDATATVTIEGRAVQSSKTVEGNKVTLGFEMPDLGERPRDVKVNVTIQHLDDPDPDEGGSWPSSFTVHYTPRAATGPPPATGGRPAPQQAPTPASAAPRQQHGPLGDAGGNSSAGKGGSTGGAGGPAAGGLGGGAGSPSGADGPGPSGSEGAAEAAPAHRQTADERAVVRSRAGRATADAAAVADRVTDARTPESVARASQPASPLPIIAAAVLVVAGIGAWLLRRRRGGADVEVPPPETLPPSDDARIEAELQELIAEERLRAAAHDEDGPPAERQQPIRAGPG